MVFTLSISGPIDVLDHKVKIGVYTLDCNNWYTLGTIFTQQLWSKIKQEVYM